MFYTEFQVLLVDDEPDVLNVSQLAMKHIKVYGAPVSILTAGSKAEAIELWKREVSPLGSFNSLVVAFIDVVMETDTAGLELCQFIREEQENYLIQLYIRTGQPGIAPERSVTDQYDINGYFTKVELTEDKLYSLVKSGARQASYIRASNVLSLLQNALIQTKGSRRDMAALLNKRYADFKDKTDIEVIFLHEDRLIAGGEPGRAIKARLQNLPGKTLSPAGDKYVIDGNQLLISVPESDSTAELSIAIANPWTIPVAEVPLFANLARSLSMLWKQGV